MTLEEIKGLLEKATPGPWSEDVDSLVVWSDDGRWIADTDEDSAALIAAAPELAALLVRAVEETRATTAELDRLCSVISDEDIAIVEPVVDSAHSLLRELGVEA